MQSNGCYQPAARQAAHSPVCIVKMTKDDVSTHVASSGFMLFGSTIMTATASFAPKNSPSMRPFAGKCRSEHVRLPPATCVQEPAKRRPSPSASSSRSGRVRTTGRSLCFLCAEREFGEEGSQCGVAAQSARQRRDARRLRGARKRRWPAWRDVCGPRLGSGSSARSEPRGSLPAVVASSALQEQEANGILGGWTRHDGTCLLPISRVRRKWRRGKRSE